jgi:hypothetical protein
MVGGFIQQAKQRQCIEPVAAIENGLTIVCPTDNRLDQSVHLNVFGKLLERGRVIFRHQWIKLGGGMDGQMRAPIEGLLLGFGMALRGLGG